MSIRRNGAKVTEEEVRLILELLETDVTQVSIAALFGISTTQVGKIKFRRQWKAVSSSDPAH